jgi:glycosyltransferase involved in cell wall biosynthesis
LKKQLKVVAVIPAYNEESSIAEVVKKASKYVDYVIVIDDGSFDQTGWVAQKYGAEAYKLPRNFGVGMATSRGFQWKGINTNLITLDGDGQHNPEEIPALLKPMIEQRADLVIGSRFLNKQNIPSYRSFGIGVITWLYNFGHKQKITDAQSCFRAYSQRLLKSLNIEEDGFGFSVETLIKARKMGFKITEVPITCIYHNDYNKNSTLSPFSHGIRVVWAVLKWRFKLRN